MLSIIIVNYRTCELTSQAIRSILKQKVNFKYEIILVDNASGDGSADVLRFEFSQQIDSGLIKFILNQVNEGFAKGNNLGIRKSSGKYILLLNSDTTLEPNVLSACVNVMEKYKQKKGVPIGALGCKVVLPNGKLDHACKRGFPTPLASLYYMLGMHKINPKKYGAYCAAYRDEDEVGEVDCLTGAFMLVPREVIKTVGALDEDYFMYGEDIDWCYRIKQAGFKIIYYPRVKITHFKGGSSSSSKAIKARVIYNMHSTMWLFYKKHYLKQYPILISIAVFSGIVIKYLMSLTVNLVKMLKIDVKNRKILKR
ncbi:MAG: glycosyl transferase family 2 [Epulopiscium sp. Nuni2H_MBin001]|nr:MAG: glycosyl transferase family 2 [Epulopiscium sp. Nuni2H_MBin001]